MDTDTPEFKIRHGLVPSAPPLPHTLSVEVFNSGGKSVLDAVFSKGTPLPAERKLRYRAKHAVVPGNSESDVAIKLWEGEFLEDPEANEWVGNVVLSNNRVRRSVPEGSEISVTIKIDTSRLINVEAFVPHLNQHFNFSDSLYVPQREEQDFAKMSHSVASETNSYQRRLDELEQTFQDSNDDSVKVELEDLRLAVDRLQANPPSQDRLSERPDPDESRRIVEGHKSVRGQLSRLERRATDQGRSLKGVRRITQVEVAEKTVNQFGASLEKQQLAMLRRELESALTRGDDKRAQRSCEEIEGLYWRVLGKQDWF
jgi:molecular chaperone DnaK